MRVADSRNTYVIVIIVGIVVVIGIVVSIIFDMFFCFVCVCAKKTSGIFRHAGCGGKTYVFHQKHIVTRHGVIKRGWKTLFQLRC